MPLTLYRRPGSEIWHIRGTVAGCRIRQSTGVSKRRHAEQIRYRLEQETLERHVYGREATITFSQAANQYMEAGGETRFLLKLIDYLGPDCLLKDVDNAMIQHMADALFPHAAPATRNRQLVTPISAVVTMAAENGQTHMRKFRRWKGGKPRMRWLSPDEAERLIEKAAPHIVPIIAFLLGSGARSSEALGLEAQNFYPDTGEAWLPETKNGHPRMLKLPLKARDLILAAGTPNEGALFRTPKGNAYALRENMGGQIKTAFDHARDKAKLGPEVTPHVLRHTWATWYYAQTRDYGGLLDLGGWRSSVAERYRKAAPSDLGDQLIKNGWDFTRLGRDLPAPEDRRREIRVVEARTLH